MSVQGVNQNLRVYVSPASAAVAPTGGPLFDLSSVNTSGGVKATGTATISGASGSIDSITVGGVEVMSGVENFDTLIATTATAVAANISAHTSVPDYNAAAVDTVITITAVLEGVAGNDLAVVTTGTTLTSVDVATSGGIGDGIALGGITYKNLSTNAHVSAIPSTASYQVVYKDMNGVVYHSPVINLSDVIDTDLARVSVAPVQQISNLTIGTATVGASYVLRLTVPGYGGLLGAQDEVNFYGMYTAVTGNSTTDIATALYTSLKKACDKAPVAFATVANPSAGVIRVTGVAQPYVQAKWSGRQVHFALSLAQPDALVAGDDGDTTVPVLGNGQYNQVAALEEFYAGENRGYANRYSDYPYNTEPTLAATVGATYKSDTITFSTIQEGANLGTQRQVIQLFFKE